MVLQQNTIWQMLLCPIMTLFIDQEALESYARSVDWALGSKYFRQDDYIILAY